MIDEAEARQAAREPKPLLADMIAALDHETARMAQSQRALVASGLRTGYHAEEMRRIACIEAAMDLLGRIRANVADWPKAVQTIIKGDGK